jgi:hypothetical protein
MQKLTVVQAQSAAAQHANNNIVTAQDVTALLKNASVTFAQIVYCTKVQLSAANKTLNIVKVTSANVILCANVSAQANVYSRKVRKTAALIASNTQENITNFVAQENYFEHTKTHCIVAHKQHTEKEYLYAIYNSSSSVYMLNNVQLTKEQVAQYCTASAAKALLQKDNTVHNVTHNVTHAVHVRTIALCNIVSIKARKQLLTV